MKVNIKKLFDNAIVPTRGSREAAGYDLYAYLEEPTLLIPAHCTRMIRTGISLEIPDGYFGGLYPRSGIATKKGLRPANCVGIIDSDYRGEIKVALHNDCDDARVIQNGERIAQLIIQPYLAVEFIEAEVLSNTERGAGGFGHTGS